MWARHEERNLHDNSLCFSHVTVTTMSRVSDMEDAKSKLDFEHVEDNPEVLTHNINAKYVVMLFHAPLELMIPHKHTGDH